MASENEILEKATDKLAESLFSDELYSTPRHEVGIKNTEQIEIPATAQTEQVAEPETAQPTTETTTTTTPVPEFDINKYVKETFGFDSPETAKEAVEKWRKAETDHPKPTPEPAKHVFNDEESKKLYEAWTAGQKDVVRDYIKKQEAIEKAADLSPIEQIKLDLKFKNPKYSNDDIQDIIEERYSYPSKPVQRDDELDNEFAARTDAYNKEFVKVDRRINRDGLEAVDNLQKHKQDLVLPDINGNQAAEYQKFLDQQKSLQVEEEKAKNAYKAALDKDYSNFKGYTTSYKDKSVDVPIEYKPPEQELNDLKNKFANDFDADEYFANRWIKTENDKLVGFNVSQQMEDVYLLENRQKVFDAIATNAASRAVLAYMQGEHNTKINGVTDRTPALNVQKTIDDRLTEKLWGD